MCLELSHSRARSLRLFPRFTETKEVVGGFAILEAGSLQQAIELTRRFLKIHGDTWDIECEVRPLVGPDFGAKGGARSA